MENDTISRQAAIELIHSLYPSSPIMRKNKERWKEKYKPYIEAEKALEQLPSAQPEIIRCKECIHWHRKNDLPYCDRIDYGYGYEPDDFCSRAKRRTDE